MKMYTIGCYKKRVIGGKTVADLSQRIIFKDLKPMTHKQAVTMISKFSDPANMFVVPLN